MNPKLNFIVFEGSDGSGKSTLAKWLASTFSYKLYKSIGGTFADVKEHFDIDKVSIRERFSFLCGESIANSFLIKEQLNNGNKLVFDRYFYSTLVYCESLEENVTLPFRFLFDRLPKPDLVIFVQTSFDVMINRLVDRGNMTLIEKKYSNEKSYTVLIDNYMKYIDVPMIIINNDGDLEEAKKQIINFLESNHVK